MARGRAGDLFLTIGGDVTPLRSAVKAGKSVLSEFGSAAIDIQREVDRAFAAMAANAPVEAKRIERSFSATFDEIRRNAKAALNAPSGQAALQIFDVASARDAAAAASAEAAALRTAATAAIAADKAAGGTNAAVRILAVASEVAAREAEVHAGALRDQAAALTLVARQSGLPIENQKKLTVATGQTRIGMQQLGFQLNDVAVGLASGQRPAIVFAQQISQVTQAVQLMSGGTSKFAAFLGGVWGIGLTLAVTVLAPLVAKLFAGADAAKKYTEATDILTAALRGESISTDALVESLQKLNEQELKALDNDTKLIDTRYRLAKATLAAAEANRTKLQTDLENAKSARDAAGERQGQATGRGLEAAAGEFARAQSEVDRIQRAVDAQTSVIGQATAQLSTEMVRFARNAATAVGRANIEFDRRLEALEAQFHGTATTAVNAQGKAVTVLRGGSLNDPNLSDAKRQQLLNELIKKEHDLNVVRQKAIDVAQKLDNAEQGKTKADAANRQSGRQISFDQAASIARAAGLQVNSGFRPAFGTGTPGHRTQEELFNDPSVNRPGNPVAPPGASAHNGANGRWAIDIQITDGVTPAKIRKVFADQGVSLTKVFKEKGHFHVEGSRSEAAAADNAAQKAADKRVDQDDNFAQQSQRLDEQLLSSRHELVQNVDAQARFASDQVEADRKQFELAVEDAVHGERLRDAQGQLLIEKNNAVVAQRQANIAVQKFIRQQDELQASLDQKYQFQNDELEYQKSITRTAGQALDIELQIIDARYKHLQDVLEIQRKSAVEAQNWARVADIDAQIANLPRAQARDIDTAKRGNRSPLDEFNNSLPKSLDEVQDKLEQIEATALRQLNDDFGTAIANALHLKGALGSVVSELAKLGLQLLESYAAGNNPLAGLFGGKRALGGGVNDGQFYLVGENGPELFAPGVSGAIIPNHMLRGVSSATAPRGVHAMPANDRGGSDWRRMPLIQNWNIHTPDANSFRRSERQILREQRRRLG